MLFRSLTIAVYAPFADELTAFCILLAWVIITGGLHLDGFADSCDGLLATVSVDRRLEIMRDPRTGSRAVIGLVLLLLGKWLCLRDVALPYLVLAPVVGRWVMTIAVIYVDYARDKGLGAFFREGATWREVSIATMTLLLVTLWADALIVVLGVMLGAGLITMWAARRLGGGITGDVYGALCEMSEWLCLLGGLLWVSV